MRGAPMRDTAMRWPPMGCMPCETHAYEVISVRDRPMRWPMGDAHLWEMHACKRHAYKMAYGRGTHMRDTPMR
jgi:hypothetical protein